MLQWSLFIKVNEGINGVNYNSKKKKPTWIGKKKRPFYFLLGFLAACPGVAKFAASHWEKCLTVITNTKHFGVKVSCFVLFFPASRRHELHLLSLCHYYTFTGGGAESGEELSDSVCETSDAPASFGNIFVSLCLELGKGGKKVSDGQRNTTTISKPYGSTASLLNCTAAWEIKHNSSTLVWSSHLRK